MKNEMMCHYRGFHLPSKKPEYVPYTAVEWEGFAAEKKVTCAEVADWLDKALATETGKKWLDGQTRNFNKTNNPSDCPREVIDMWESFIQKRAQADVAEALEAGFAEVYLAKTMDESFWNISGVLAQLDVVAWRGEGKKHMYIWFMFESSPTGLRANILEDRKLQRLFDALEVADSNRNIVKVRSPAILLTDAVGFHEVLGHLMRRNKEFTTRLWDWHVITYITATDDSFPNPRVGANYTVFVIFCFGYSITDNARKWFQKFFTPGDPLQPVCDSRIVEHNF